eukprot:snap_masked-scaffold_7-processed-gene-6.32-mRNA-1 protein AED:1.00 eAED:1.00 QI:0/0/0/0/1/1/2/0/325
MKENKSILEDLVAFVNSDNPTKAIILNKYLLEKPVPFFKRFEYQGKQRFERGELCSIVRENVPEVLYGRREPPSLTGSAIIGAIYLCDKFHFTSALEELFRGILSKLATISTSFCEEPSVAQLSKTTMGRLVSEIQLVKGYISTAVLKVFIQWEKTKPKTVEKTKLFQNIVLRKNIMKYFTLEHLNLFQENLASEELLHLEGSVKKCGHNTHFTLRISCSTSYSQRVDTDASSIHLYCLPYSMMMNSSARKKSMEEIVSELKEANKFKFYEVVKVPKGKAIEIKQVVARENPFHSSFQIIFGNNVTTCLEWGSWSRGSSYFVVFD